MSYFDYFGTIRILIPKPNRKDPPTKKPIQICDILWPSQRKIGNRFGFVWKYKHNSIPWLIIPPGGCLNVAAWLFWCLWILCRLACFNENYVVLSNSCLTIPLIVCFSKDWPLNMDISRRRVLLFWRVVSQSDSGAMVLAPESGSFFCAKVWSHLC